MADSISKNSGTQELNYEALVAEALQLVQKLSGSVWTDFNVHDPGVTLLEEIVFAITELGYKTNFDIEDYLASKDNVIDLQREALFTPDQVDVPGVATLCDYSSLFSQKMEGVSSVKFLECDNGVYNVCIYALKTGELERPLVQRRLLDSFTKLWNEWRNLGENVVSVDIEWTQNVEKKCLEQSTKKSSCVARVRSAMRNDFLEFSPIAEQFPTIYREGENAEPLQAYLAPVEALFKKFLATLDNFTDDFSVDHVSTDTVRYNRILNQMLAVYGVRFPDDLFRKIHGEREDSASTFLLKSKLKYLQLLPEWHLHRCGKHFRERIEVMLGVKTQIFDGIFFENGFGKVYVVWERPERYAEDVRRGMEAFVRRHLPAHLVPLFYWVPKSLDEKCNSSWFEKNQRYMSESIWI